MLRRAGLVRWLALVGSAVTMAGATCESLAITFLPYRITEPRNGAVIRPGTMMKVKVGFPSPVTPVVKVTYTLLEEDRAMEDKVEAPPRVTAASAPFEAEILVPPEAVGGMRLLAVAEVAERRGSYILFDETAIRIEPEAALVALRAEAPVRFTETLGEVQFLSVRGTFADRIVRDLTPGHSGTTYVSSNEKIVRVNPDGRAQGVGNGRAEITARNRTKEVKIPVVVSVENAENRPPVAHAGEDQAVTQGKRVRLDAIRSADPEGENPAYYWSQVKGLPVDLVEPLSLRPYFTAPVVEVPRTLRFRLIVKDKEGAESFPAYVNVTVLP